MTELVELSPFDWKTYAAVLFSIPVFYLLGAFILPRRDDPLSSVSLRVSTGMLFAISIIATVYTLGNTGFSFYAILLLFLAFRKPIIPDLSDIGCLRPTHVALFLVLLVFLITVEAQRADIRVDGGVYIGNSDVAFYGSFGYSLVENGIETNPEKVFPGCKPMLYHFGDLWPAGFYARYAHILPYYAYMLVSRVIMVSVVSLLLFSWVMDVSRKKVLSMLTVVLFLFSVYMEFFKLPDTGIDLFRPFTFYYPCFCNPSHLIVAIGFLTFLLVMQTNRAIGLIGVWFLPFLNAGILLVPMVASVVLAFAEMLIAINQKRNVWTVIKRHSLSVAVATIPLLYYRFSGRLHTDSAGTLDMGSVYVMIHTLIRALLSYVFIAPYLIGLFFFATQRSSLDRLLFRLVVSLTLGTLISFSVIFPLIQGNSVKILSIHFSAVLAAVGLVGLVGMYAKRAAPAKWIGAACILLITAQTARVWLSSGGYALLYDWGVYLDDYRDEVWLPARDYIFLRDHIPADSEVGYFMYNPEHDYGGVQYSIFNHLKGVLPGVAFFRMNAAETDTMISKEQAIYFKETALGHFAFQNRFDSASVSDMMLKFIDPEVIIRPKRESYIFPSMLSNTYPQSVENENYLIYSK